MQTEDPRYRGNREFYLRCLTLLLALFVVFFILFWLKSMGYELVKDDPRGDPLAVPVAATPLTPEENLKDLHAKLFAARGLVKTQEISRRILEIAPEDGYAWAYLGKLHQESGDFAKAYAAYDRSIASPTRTYYSSYLKALLLRKEGRFPEAIATLEAAGEQKVDSVSLSNLVMIFRVQAGQSEYVRAQVRSYDGAGIQAVADQWLLGAAALSMQDGDKSLARRLALQFRNMVRPQIYDALIADSFFDPFRFDPAYDVVFQGTAKDGAGPR